MYEISFHYFILYDDFETNDGGGKFNAPFFASRCARRHVLIKMGLIGKDFPPVDSGPHTSRPLKKAFRGPQFYGLTLNIMLKQH